MTSGNPASMLSQLVADRLAQPDRIPQSLISQPWWRQSLAHGAPGIALLHIELAASGSTSWQQAFNWIAFVTSGPITAGSNSHLFYGAPALAHALACAAAHRSGPFLRTLDLLDQTIAADARVRVETAHARIDARRLPELAEFDLIRGLTGIGIHLLRREPEGKEIRAILEYLVRLTEPVNGLPGWWTTTGPSGRDSERFPGGHANLGVAHGIGGPLALLALASLSGVIVEGQRAGISLICRFLDRWRTDADEGSAWPFWIDQAQFEAGVPTSSGPQRLGWCYGTAGLARVQQLAALAIGDRDRQNFVESALIQALAGQGGRTASFDRTLCHGYAGLAHLAAVTAVDSSFGAAEELKDLARSLAGAVQHEEGTAPLNAVEAPGLLEGASGVALAMLTPPGSSSRSGWDTCLLLPRIAVSSCMEESTDGHR